MIFIDGGYLIRNLKDTFRIDTISYTKLAEHLTRFASQGNVFPDLIRSYYYDAITEDDSSLTQEQKEMTAKRVENLKRVEAIDGYEVRTGRLKHSSNKKQPKQKGVDTLIALDMLSKAYENHYDVGVLVAGDDDFLDVVKAVKNAGKRVYGVYFDGHISADLLNALDRKQVIEQNLAVFLRS